MCMAGRQVQPAEGVADTGEREVSGPGGESARHPGHHTCAGGRGREGVPSDRPRDQGAHGRAAGRHGAPGSGPATPRFLAEGEHPCIPSFPLHRVVRWHAGCEPCRVPCLVLPLLVPLGVWDSALGSVVGQHTHMYYERDNVAKCRDTTLQNDWACKDLDLQAVLEGDLTVLACSPQQIRAPQGRAT